MVVKLLRSTSEVDEMDNMKKKKLDGKRFALSQKHERDYVRKISEKYLSLVDKFPTKVLFQIDGTNKRGYLLESLVSPRSLAKICKATIKLLDRYDKK